MKDPLERGSFFFITDTVASTVFSDVARSAWEVSHDA
jgi:hypothetical protein